MKVLEIYNRFLSKQKFIQIRKIRKGSLYNITKEKKSK